MKKSMLIAAAGLFMVSMAACSGKKENKEVAAETPAEVENTVNAVAYTGVLPAADCDGINYTLSLVFNEEENGGTYQAAENYFLPTPPLSKGS